MFSNEYPQKEHERTTKIEKVTEENICSENLYQNIRQNPKVYK